uniref:SH3 domain-containing protein n=1 Tax=Steinernema glaseri TaxID=37863 RepID=A0A1I7Y1N9_9BILA
MAKLQKYFSKLDSDRPNYLNQYVPISSLSSRLSHQRAVVRHWYFATCEDELTLTEGDVIEVIETLSNGWMRGRLHGRIGMFPANFVAILDSGATISPKPTEKKMRSKSAPRFVADYYNDNELDDITRELDGIQSPVKQAPPKPTPPPKSKTENVVRLESTRAQECDSLPSATKFVADYEDAMRELDGIRPPFKRGKFFSLHAFL